MTADGPAFRLLPRLDPENEFFWTSGADGRLRFLRCQACQEYVHPPSPVCPTCLSSELDPVPVSGRATVVAHTLNVHGWIPGSEPYLVAWVAIDEQPDVRLTTNIVDTDADQVRIGQDVEVRFEAHGEIHLPLFRPVSEAAGR